jgi:hypothetical protein
LEGVEDICRAAENYDDQPPWEALSGRLHEFVGFAANKRALAEDLLAYIDRDAEVFNSCANAIYGAGQQLLQRAQEAGVVRTDAGIADVTKMVSGIAATAPPTPPKSTAFLGVALDGLRV